MKPGGEDLREVQSINQSLQRRTEKLKRLNKCNKVDKLGTDYRVYLRTTADVSVEKPFQQQFEAM